MFKLILHDGPARLGKWREKTTPHLLPFTSKYLVEDEPMAYNVPRELAEWSVEVTIHKAKLNPDKNKIVVIHGSKYSDLRIECAKKLQKIGYHQFLLANPEELIRRPLDLIKILVSVRETLAAHSSLFYSFAEINFIPLLVYLGVDFIGDAAADFYAQLGVLLTCDGKYYLKDYDLHSIDYHQLREKNLETLNFVIREVQENIKQGTLRNLVEKRCHSSPESMSALRILDRDYSGFIDKYTPLY